MSATISTPINQTVDDEHNVNSSQLVEPPINVPTGTSDLIDEDSAVNDTNRSSTERSAPVIGNEPVNSAMTSNNAKPTGSNTPPPAPVRAMTSSNIEPGSSVQPATYNCFVSLPKLTKEDIDMYKPLPPPLSELDTEDEEIISRVKYGMSLHDRKKRDTLRPSRAAKHGVSYKDLANSASDSSENEPVRRKPRPASGPSLE